ncbi:MAG: hypothetical protein GX633_03580 [Clostridiales bacterium]|nr:hypothetical protein [Clostridiales bacterium]
MKRTLSFVLCLALIFSMFGSVLVGTAGAAAYKDLSANHWAVNEISYMSDKSVLQGNLGNFRPEDPVTKAEFVKIENYTFGLKNTSNHSFADVSPSKWYYTDIMKAATNGYLTTKGNFVYPDADLTREEACALIMRYLGVEPKSSYSTFADAGQISGEYLPYVIAATENNIIKGYPNNTFRPKNTITRAEASTIFYRMAGTIYMNSSYGTDPGANPTNAVINTSGITITNANLLGTVYVTEGCEHGTITLQNCTINGTLKIRGAATVNLVNCTISKIEVDTTSGNGATVVASGTTNVNAVETRTSTTLKNETTGDNNGFRNVTSNMRPFNTLTLDGKFPSVGVGTPNTTIALYDKDTVIEYLTIGQGASNTKLTGAGTVKQANIAAGGAEFSVVPEKYNIGAGLYAMFAGVKYTGSGAGGVYPKFYIVDDALEIRDLNNASGVFYYIIVGNNAPAPTADQVIAGVAYGATPVLYSGNIVETANVEGVTKTAALPANTNYDLYYYYRATGAAVSGNPTKVDIYTQNAPFFAAGYPAEDTFAQSTAGTYTKTIKVKATGSATAYAIAVPKGSVAPSASQVYEAAKGTTSYNSTVAIAARTTATVSAAGETTLSLTGLQNTAYDYYVVLAVGTSPVAIRSTAAITNVNALTGFVASYPIVTSYSNIGGTAIATVEAKTSAPGTVYFLAYSSAGAVPSAAQIMSAGQPVALVQGADGYYTATTTMYPGLLDSVAAVFVPSGSTSKIPAYGRFYTGSILAAIVTPPTNVPTISIPTQLLTNTSPLVLVYSDRMYYNNVPLSSITDQATLKALFPVTSAVDGTVPAYTVAVTDNVAAPNNTAVTITPIAPATWKENTVYTVTPNSTIKNAAGNVPVVKSGNFIINVARPSATLAPTTGVSTSDGVLTLTYTQPMKIKTPEGGFADINNSNAVSYFTLYKNGDSTNPISIAVTVNDDRTVFTIDPQVDLAPNTQYVIAVSESITNGAGYAPSQLTYSFTTAAQAAVATPVIIVKDSDGVVVTGDLLEAGAYTVTIVFAEAESKVYYTADGTTPTDGSTLYTGPFTVNVEPLKKTTIKAIAKANTGVDKASSPEAVRVLEGKAVSVTADIPSGSALKANSQVVLSPSYGSYKIKYAIADAKLGADDALAAAKSGTIFSGFVDGLNGKYLYAVAVNNAGDPIGPVAEFRYYDFDVTDIISPDTLSFVYEGDKVRVGFFDDSGEADFPAYPYELIVTIKIDGVPLVAGGSTYEDLNLGKKNLIYTIKDEYNKKIEVSAEVVASGTNETVSFAESALYFANPAPIIKVTTGGNTTEFVGKGNKATIGFNAQAIIESVFPDLPAGFNMTWGAGANASKSGSNNYDGIAISDNKTVMADFKVIANANADKLVTSDLDLKFRAVAPRLMDGTYTNEHEADFVYASGGDLNAEYLTGVDNYYKINSEPAVKYENLTDGELGFDWAADYPDIEIVKISLWSVHTGGTADTADDRKSEVKEYIVRKNGPSYANPAITVTYEKDGKDVAYTEGIPVAKLGDKVTASTKVVGAEIMLCHTEIAVGTQLEALGSPVTYVIEEEFTGAEVVFCATIDPPGSHEVTFRTVRVRPVAPTIVVMPDGKSFQLRMDKQHADTSEVLYSGVRYTTDGSDPIANGTDVAYDDFLDPGGAFRYAKVEGDYSDGYYIRAVAYSENASARWYSAEIEKYKPAAPVVTYNGFVLETSPQFYNVRIGDKITITGGDTLYIRHAKTAADLASAPWTEFTSGDEFQIPTDVVGARYFVDAKVRNKDVDSNFVSLKFRTTKLPTFDPANGTSIAPSGGEQITISYPSTTTKPNTFGDKTYFYQFNDGIVTTFTRDDNTAFDQKVIAPAGTEGDTLTLTAGVRFEEKDADDNVIFFSEISDSASYIYGVAPFFKAYYKSSGNFVEIPAKTDVSGTYFEVEEGTEVFLEITNEGSLTVKWNVSATEEPTDLNQDYSEANAATLKSNISDTLNAGTTITNAKPLVYVAAKFVENDAMSRIQLRLTGATLPIPVSSLYMDGGYINKWSKTSVNYVNSADFGTDKLFYDNAPAGFSQFIKIPSRANPDEIAIAGDYEMTLADFDADGEAVFDIWNEDADNNKGLVSSYTFKLTDVMTKLTSPEITPADGSILSAGDKIKATTEYGDPVELWRAYVFEGSVPAAGDWKTKPNIEVTVPADNQGKTVVYHAKVVSGAKESDIVDHTFYIRPADVDVNDYAFGIGADNKATISIGKPATGTVVGVVLQQEGQAAQYADFGANPEVMFTVTDAAIKVGYYYKPTDTTVTDTVSYIVPAAGYVYSKNALEIAAAPEITEIKFGNCVIALDANLSAENVLYVAGESVYATATSGTDEIYSKREAAAYYGRILDAANGYHVDAGFDDIEILLTPVAPYTTPIKALSAEQINGGFNVLSIQAFDSDPNVRRPSRVVVIKIIAVKAPQADVAGNGAYNIQPIPGYSVNYEFVYTIEKKDDTATGDVKVGAYPTFANVQATQTITPSFVFTNPTGPWVFTVKITATIDEIPGYEWVLEDIYDCVANGANFASMTLRP